MVNITQQYDKIPASIMGSFEFISAGSEQKIACMPENVLYQLLQIANANIDNFAQMQQDIQDIADAETAWAEYIENPDQHIPNETFYKVLDGGNPIRVYREWRKLTVKDLSAKTGLAENVIYSMENGNRIGKVDAYSKIADALNVTMDDIVPIQPSEK